MITDDTAEKDDSIGETLRKIALLGQMTVTLIGIQYMCVDEHVLLRIAYDFV